MEQQADKGEFFRKIMLFLLIVVAPAMSWYYLSGGLKWRKDAISELGNFGKIREIWSIEPTGERVNLIDKKVCAIHLFPDNPDLTPANQKILDISKDLSDRFAKSEAFKSVLIWDGATPAFDEYYKKLSAEEGNGLQYTLTSGGWRTILINQYEYFNLQEKKPPVADYFALSDTSGTIRRFYDANDPKQIERMIQHIAILLPPAK